MNTRFFAAVFAAWVAVPLAAQQPAQQAPQPQQPSVTSSGGFLIARGLYASCASAEEREQLACRTYIMGIADSMAMHKDNRWAPPVLCNATELQISQLGPLYVSYLRRNSDKADWTAASTVYNALAESFPCRPQQP